MLVVGHPVGGEQAEKAPEDVHRLRDITDPEVDVVEFHLASFEAQALVTGAGWYSFIDDHPGGDDLILKYAGKDVGEVMKDPEEHVHSESAYGIMDEFLIGRLGQGENVVSDGK